MSSNQTNSPPVKVDAIGARSTFEEWLNRGDAVGVFENADLSSRSVGHQVFLPLTPDEQESVTPGQTHAPDHPSYGLGWRYLLKTVATSLAAFDFLEDTITKET